MTADLSAFDTLAAGERLFVRGRLWSAPLEEVAARAPAGRVVDLGCGHGLVVALLAQGRPDRTVLGVDLDPRKIEWARASVGRLANVALQVDTAQGLAAQKPAGFDAVVVCDVLYLLPAAERAAFLIACRTLLAPGGQLLLKEAEADHSWRHWKCLAQEKLMVQLLKRTKSSGAIGFLPRAQMVRELAQAGFGGIETVVLSRGYTTPHVLFAARRE